VEFDGKRLRKTMMRKTVDYNSSFGNMLHNRVWARDYRDRRAIQPDISFYPDIVPPQNLLDNPVNAVTTRFVKTATNKMRCPIFCLSWTPEGRRLITGEQNSVLRKEAINCVLSGASSGEFTLWNGLTFNFETILQAHDSPVRTMQWSHNDVWMVTGDHSGYIKYWQSNMNNVKMFQAHKEAIRRVSFCPTDAKFASCSDDGTVRIWDFQRCHEERVLRGHGADVKCVDWHPHKSIVVSGSKDNQQPIKLWDPKSGTVLTTIHAHKSTVMDCAWNQNGNWLVTASRDHLLKLFDIRNLKEEMQTFRGHKKEASAVRWHPVHENMFTSGGSDGSIMFWQVGADKEVGVVEAAHESIVWCLAWHPVGHILTTGSNDHTVKFWSRNRPGDSMRDKYNLNTLPPGQEEDYGNLGDSAIGDSLSQSSVSIPGMGPEDRVSGHTAIPGLDFQGPGQDPEAGRKKQPFSKPIPRSFQVLTVRATWLSIMTPFGRTPGTSRTLATRTAASSAPSGRGTPRGGRLEARMGPVAPGRRTWRRLWGRPPPRPSRSHSCRPPPPPWSPRARSSPCCQAARSSTPCRRARRPCGRSSPGTSASAQTQAASAGVGGRRKGASVVAAAAAETLGRDPRTVGVRGRPAAAAERAATRSGARWDGGRRWAAAGGTPATSTGTGTRTRATTGTGAAGGCEGLGPRLAHWPSC
jgi:polyadenylation factor subunit 2